MERTGRRPRTPAPAGNSTPERPGWTFLSNHAHVLLCLAEDGSARVRDVAGRVGITERAVHNILADLEQSGAIRRIREGRRNRYELHLDIPLRHAIEAHCRIGDLIDMVRKGGRKSRRAARA